MKQTTSTILMIRPANFGFNIETTTNDFHQKEGFTKVGDINDLANIEFDRFVAALVDQGVKVLTVEDTDEPVKCDAVFPNSWFSTHSDGKLILYPMLSPNRRLERRKDLVAKLLQQDFKVKEIIDLSFFEEDEQFLEGTGSMVMDHQAKLIYACRTERTHPVPLGYLAKLLNYKLINFTAVQVINGEQAPVCYTNEMMHIGSDLAVICLDCIVKTSEKQTVQKFLTQSGKKVVPITIKQKSNFAGNMLEVTNDGGEKFTVMSQTALDSLTIGQIQLIEKYTTIISPSIPTIESFGGGSARSMMAEIFLPREVI